jgi:hypothetical protein
VALPLKKKYLKTKLPFKYDMLSPKISSNHIWVAGRFGQPMTLIFKFLLELIFCVTPCNHKLQGELTFIQNEVVSKKLWHFFY